MAFNTGNLKPLSADDAIVPLARLGSISGVVFNDLNGDGIQDAGESGLRNRFVFVDYNRNGILNPGESYARTRDDGSYTIRKVYSGDYDVFATVREGWHPTSSFTARTEYLASDATYQFVEISKTGSAMVFGDSDDGYAVFESANGVTFYGQTYTEMSISVNGFLTFQTDPQYSANYNTELPDPTNPNLIAPLWDDYTLGDKGKVYVLEDTQNDQLIIEWKNVTQVGDTSGATYTFETIISEDGSIKFLYKNVAAGSSATIGVENADATEATQISYNQPVVAQTAYELTPYEMLFGKTTVHLDPGQVVTGVDFGQVKNAIVPTMPGFDLGQHAPMIAHAHDLALA